jgi:hypothetical protein
VAAICPWVKLPLWLWAMLNTAARGMITVESLAFAVAEPPPDTLTLFTCGDVALAPTFTVTVIAG